jgi:hypothetical protein
MLLCLVFFFLLVVLHLRCLRSIRACTLSDLFSSLALWVKGAYHYRFCEYDISAL